MLSATHTIDDVKTQLKNTYSYFGYTDDYDYEADITTIADDVERIYFVPRISQTQYDITKAKDKVSLTAWETYLYWAEVFIICFEFLKWLTSSTNQLQTYKNETLKVEGYEHTISNSGADNSGRSESLKLYRSRAYEYFKLAGYDLSAINRTSHIFEDSETDANKKTYILEV